MTLVVLSGCGGNNSPQNSGNNNSISNNKGTGAVNTGSPNTPPQNGNNNKPAAPSGRVVNVVSQDFKLSDGFIVPIERQTIVPDGFIGISTADEFDKIRLNSNGKYILMADIDLKSLSDYEPFDFTGFFDGNGYKIQFAAFYFTNISHSLTGTRIETIKKQVIGIW